jgi:hypothetical protein
MSTSPIEQMQDDITGRLLSLPALQHVGIEKIRPRDKAEALQIQTRIDQALAGLVKRNDKSGAVAIVQMPTIDVPEPDIPGPQPVVVCSVRIFENPMVNMLATGSRLSAESIGLTALGALHHYDPGTGGSPFYADQRALEPNGDYPGKIVYDLYIRSRLDVPMPVKSAPPQIDNYGGEIVLTGTGSLYYTTDGTYPHSGNDSATLYTAPFTPGAGTTIRAAAYADEKPGSDIRQLIIT